MYKLNSDDVNVEPQEQVTVEDYRGPGVEPTPYTSEVRRVDAEPSFKQGSNNTLFDLAPSHIDWPLGLSTIGRLFSAGAVGGLLPSSFASLLLYNEYHNLPLPLHDIVFNWTGVFLACLATMGFALCTIALFRNNTSRNPSTVVFRSRIGLVLSSVLLIAELLVYLHG